jgi:hypothetical protein
MEDWLGRIARDPFADWRYSERPELVTTTPTAGSGTESSTPTARKPTPNSTSGGGGSRPESATSKRSASPEEDYDAIINKRLKVSKELVELEAYFYATLGGEAKFLEAEFKADMAFKCHICKKVFMNNIEFMKHLHLHVESDRATAIDLADLTQCKYCYKERWGLPLMHVCCCLPSYVVPF